MNLYVDWWLFAYTMPAYCNILSDVDNNRDMRDINLIDYADGKLIEGVT
mgnify:CR=1 FL=1